LDFSLEASHDSFVAAPSAQNKSNRAVQIKSNLGLEASHDSLVAPRIQFRQHHPDPCREREFVIDNLLVRIHFIVVMIRWTGLAP